MEPARPPSCLLYSLAFLGLLLASAFFSATETAFLSASRLHLRYLREKGDRRARRVERLLARRSRFLNSILVGNNVVNVALSSVATALAVSAAGVAGVGIATAAASVAILAFGEIIPKTSALSRPERAALSLSAPAALFVAAATPVVTLLGGLTFALERLGGKKPEGSHGRVTEDDLRALIEVGEEEGVLAEGGGRMMEGILDSSDLSARDIMTPRPRIAALPLDATRAEILDASRETGFSRFPVFGESIDDVRGIVHVKDVFLAGDGSPNRSARDFMRPAPFVFESSRIPALQRLLHEKNSNCAIVIDEFGGTAGLVAIENIFEEIFGSIRDEYDAPDRAGIGDRRPGAGVDDVRQGDASGTAPARGDAPTELFVEGSSRLDELSGILGIPLESRHYDTIAGYLMERADDLPRAGYRHCEQGYSFTVLSTTGHRIDEIRIASGEGQP